MTPIIHKKINTLALSGIILIIIVFSFGIVAPIPVKAQALPANYTLLEPLPCITGTGNNCTAGSSVTSINIQTYIVYIFKLMIALAVFAAVVMCIIGGFQYMLSESVLKKQDAKDTIKNAVLGLTGALLSWLILYTINPNLVNVSLVTVPSLNLKTTAINLSPTTINQQTTAIVNNNDAIQTQAQNDQTQADNEAAVLYATGCTDANGGNLITDDPSCQQAYSQWLADQATAASSTSAAIISQAQSAFTLGSLSTAQQANGGLTPQDALAHDTSTYNTAMAQLQANNDIAGEQALTQTYNQTQVSVQNQINQTTVANYANGQYANQAEVDAAKAQALAAIESGDTPIIKNITDPTVKQAFVTNQKNEIQSIVSAKPRIVNYTSSSGIH